jgi:hypothetical protein
MKVIVRTQFDPDLPLFMATVKDNLIEVYFHGNKPDGKTWRLEFNKKIFHFGELYLCWVKAQELLNKKLGKEIKFWYPINQEEGS